MDEMRGPDLAPLAREAHLLQPVLERAQTNPDRVVAGYFEDGALVDVTAKEFADRVMTMAKGLIASGVATGDRVAIMSHTRIEWPLFDYAILAAGGVTVPIYETSSAEQVQWILSDSEAVMLVVETAEMRAIYDSVADAAPLCREALVIDDGAAGELTTRGEHVDDDDLGARIGRITIDDLATIIYTSGTTGRPKGCVLTHGNLRTNVLQNLDALQSMLGEDERSLLFLPLAHSLAKIIMLVGFEYGIDVVFATTIERLQQELPVAKPTMVVSVPRVFEKIFNAAEHKARAEHKGAIFEHSAKIATKWSTEQAEGHVHAWTNFEHTIYGKLVYAKLQEVFGGELRFAFSGGGPLGERLTHFYNGIGVKVFEGYGLTETSPTLTVNREDAWTPGTVGRPVAGTTIRIAPDGEILAKGPQVFSGYWHNDLATAETFDDEGWFKTGDIGVLDDDGFLRITGRKKELIVTAAGKNVAPAPLEDRIRAHELVSQAVVVGDGKPFIAAMIAIDEEAFADWAAHHAQPGLAVADLVDDPDLRAEIQKAVDEANLSVSHAEAIKRFVILPHDLTIDAGELTPTLKVRRAIVEKTYAHLIDALYNS
ncbi:MAG TPA: long-chain fatty acid--CoA ligase [Acidimicrobiales bacterium]|nr:long-chain fatty acid--CoA ligase [Acidimicrobiales bacterium]